jgi:D-beta-D-heptose 7-phosphate kinase/D-beta-D-heptose 1-phosphate adenosyltransferase
MNSMSHLPPALPDPADSVAAWRGAPVLCIGDVMLDHFVYGEVERISPEAPIPVLRVVRESRTLGGAGNVVRNLDALGAAPGFLSVVGDDAAGSEVAGLVAQSVGVAAADGLIVEPGRVTSLKTRYIAAHQQMLRADRERAAPLAESTRERLLRRIADAVPRHAATIVSDYAKGVLADGVAEAVIAAARAAGRPVVVDPKGTDYGRYRGATLLKPNRGELARATGGLPVSTEGEVVAAARALIERHGFGALLVSLSQDGMVLVEAESGAVHVLPAEAREVFDVSGAGDTVVATVAAALAGGLGVAEAARLANAAAGIVVGKVGTAVAYAEELVTALAAAGRSHVEPIAARKILTLPLALDAVARWRRQGLRVGFTNGCFDILHPGHVALLAQARRACDRLVVGLNSDASVKRLKGPSRPVQPEGARAEVLASLASVDLVVLFEEDTPMAVIEAIRPDVLVKGADYRIDQVVGADFVQSYGGTVLLADLVAGHSTTATIARMGKG